MSKANYIRNHNTNYGECVPVGIFNICNYFGANLTRKHDFENIRHLSSHIPYEGAYRSDYEQLIRALFNCHKIKNPTLSDIDRGLDNGQIALVSYRWFRDEIKGNHLAVIIGKTNKFYRCLNYELGKTNKLYKRSIVAYDLRPKCIPDGRIYTSRAYFIEGVK